MTALAPDPSAGAIRVDDRPSRKRRYTARALLATATVLAVLAIFAVWADRQALDADNWSSTSTELLQDPAVQTQVAGFLVDSLYANVDVAGQLAQVIPPPF